MDMQSNIPHSKSRTGWPYLWSSAIRRRPNFVTAPVYVFGFLLLWFYVSVLLVVLWHFGSDILAYDTPKIDKSIVYLGSTLAAPAALWAVFTAIQQILVSRENNFTALFSNSIEQLGTKPPADKLGETERSLGSSFDVRIAGIYGLERIARDSSRDHWPIMEILCRYVRQNYCATNPPPSADPTDLINWLKALPEPPFDLEAAMTAIGRRPREKIQLERDLRNRLEEEIKARREVIGIREDEEDERVISEVDESFRLKFDGVNLRKLQLWHCDFGHALFRKCNMEGVLFWGCNLSDAKFADSGLSGSNFFDCCLDRAIFSNNNLFYSQLSRVTLRDTRFYKDVDVSDTMIFETNLDEVHKTLRPKWSQNKIFNLKLAVRQPPKAHSWPWHHGRIADE